MCRHIHVGPIPCVLYHGDGVYDPESPVANDFPVCQNLADTGPILEMLWVVSLDIGTPSTRGPIETSMLELYQCFII